MSFKKLWTSFARVQSAPTLAQERGDRSEVTLPSLDVDSHLFDLAGELVVALFACGAHVRSFVDAHVGGVVGGEDVRVGVFDTSGP